jgi:nucleotide-binding universal stress UspA family protein
MHRFRNLAVALSRTAADAGTIRYAALIARLAKAAAVRLVHVLPAAGDQNAALEELNQAATQFPAAPALCDVLSGPLTDRLLTYAAEHKIDLMFVGHKHDTPGRRAIARRLAMKAPCSVWMVPEGSPASIRRILVPVDFSDHSEDTLRVAVDLARASGAQCVPLHVYFNARSLRKARMWRMRSAALPSESAPT